MELTDARALVTGGAGFIGSHLVDALVDRDVRVRVLDDFSSGTRDNLLDADADTGVDVIEGDVRDADDLDTAMAGVDVVFHEAAVVDVTESVDDPLGTHEINATGGLNVLDAARRADARVVIASSAAVYGHPERVPIAESDPTRPTSPYGLQKLALDRYATLYHELYGLETVALRYFNVYGPRSAGGPYAGVIDVFRDQAGEGRPITVDGDGTQTRDFVHVDDVVRANLLAATTDAVGEAYNVGRGEATSIRDLAERVREAVGSDSEIVHTDPRPGDVDHSTADLTKARERLGYEPTVSLEEGLADLVRRSGESS
ncbi:NAD-dependent epimerase/dehydratase family protein [Salinigranum sp. GCM10025319]|uniref:NAD-dependent epimerase/dehydratase family protein n=1 Tax=Salinigranum sp. GCM10025319 TaxID=3252687 RepID=UPI00360F833E